MGAQANFYRDPWLKLIATGGRSPAPTEKGGRLMGFIGGSSARELDAQTDLPDSGPIDEIDYELEIELAAKESESESSFEDDAPDQPDAIPANNTSDLFELFFLERARFAFVSRGS